MQPTDGHNFITHAITHCYPGNITHPLQTSSMSSSPVPTPEPGQFPLFITISGILGAGKSTLAAALADKLNLPVFYEPVKDNVYLEDFYKDISKYAFPMQIYLLNVCCIFVFCFFPRAPRVLSFTVSTSYWTITLTNFIPHNAHSSLLSSYPHISYSPT